MDNILLRVENLSKIYRQNHEHSEVGIKDLSFELEEGKVLGIVGESGCGKTTIALCLSGLLPFKRGKIWLQGKNLNKMGSKERNVWLRTNIQYIFQNPAGSLHPLKKIRKIFTESVNSIQRLTHKNLNHDFEEMIEKVGLNSSVLDKFPDAFAGGEKQRITIARALLVKPKLLIADEAISSSDITTQAKILNLVEGLNRDGLSIIFITHDLIAAHFLCDWIIVLKDGKIEEQNTCQQIFHNPQSQYTKELVSLSQ